jgi:EAL domain-containing protein (putative c-di-GMP-specific phosphodiesterase class I)
MTDGGPGNTIVRATVAMAHGLGLRVVAEGVETERQLLGLREVDCDEAQGFLFGRAIPPEEIEAFMQNWQGAAHVVAGLPQQRASISRAGSSARR